MKGIAKAVVEFGFDEGRHSAICAAERWQEALEQMAEVADVEERDACSLLLLSVRKGLDVLISSQETRPTHG